jgi:CheY-like chemotaxis protein
MAKQDKNHLKILIADDEEMILELYYHVLGQHHDTSPSESEMDVLGDELFSNGNTVTVPAKPVYDLTLCRQGEEAVEAARKAESEGYLSKSRTSMTQI